MHFSASSEGGARPARRISPLEDALAPALLALPLPAALLLAAAMYAAVALALPLGTGTNGVPLLMCNVIGAMLGLSLTLARLYPEGEARVAHVLERAEDHRDVSSPGFE